ncbi:MAG: hypothetical protein ACI4SB_01675 [Acutalibacteraceae bacterium]
MNDLFSLIAKKFFAITSALILALSITGAPKIAEDGTVSSDLSQTSVVESKRPYDIGLKDFYEKSVDAFVIPGLNEGFIPQGLFYDEAHDAFLISGYYENKVLPSKVILLDGEGNFIKSVSAVYETSGKNSFGHFGGVAAFEDNVYIATTTVTLVLSFSDILEAENNANVAIKKSLYTDVTCSYVNVCDGVLYIGEYKDKTVDGTLKSPHKIISKSGEIFYARCNAFILEKGSEYGIKSDMIDSDGNITPDFAFTSPLKAQGMARLSDGRIVYTCSATNITNSNVYIFNDVTEREPDETLTINGKDVPLYYCKICDRQQKLKAPVLLEEITVHPDGNVYILCESAAMKYRHDNKNPIDCVMSWDIW